jgi:hypothetical protein
MERSAQPQSELTRCRPWIEAALGYSGGTHDFADVVDMIGTGQLQFWPAPKGCLVTEIITYPKKRVLNVFLGGGDMAQILDMQDAVTAWAKAQGCDATTIQGRPGWERVFAKYGWKRTHTVLSKDI